MAAILLFTTSARREDDAVLESLLLIRWTSFIQVFIFPRLGKNRDFYWYHVCGGSGLYEWVHKFVMEGVVNHPNLVIKFITCFVQPHVTTDYAKEKCVYAGRCLGLITITLVQ